MKPLSWQGLIRLSYYHYSRTTPCPDSMLPPWPLPSYYLYLSIHFYPHSEPSQDPPSSRSSRRQRGLDPLPTTISTQYANHPSHPNIPLTLPEFFLPVNPNDSHPSIVNTIADSQSHPRNIGTVSTDSSVTSIGPHLQHLTRQISDTGSLQPPLGIFSSSLFHPTVIIRFPPHRFHYFHRP